MACSEDPDAKLKEALAILAQYTGSGDVSEMTPKK